MAHNFKTAYFIIPPTIEHGDELLCSFPSCRSAGAKFRYCLHCKVPVAKRNFRNRHKHGNLGGFDKKKSASSGNLKTPEAERTPEAAKSGEEAKMPEVPTMDGGEKPAAVDGAESSESKPEAKADAAKSDEAAASANGTVSISSTQDAGKVQEWVQLMENKPDPSDKQAMAVWMMSLMNATGGDGGAAPPAAAVEAVVEDKKPAAKTEIEAEIAPVDALAATVAEADKSSTAEEEGSANSSDSGVAKREAEERNEEDASSTSSASSQPPKKKFKQEYEEV